jgi:hypothetical protein
MLPPSRSYSHPRSNRPALILPVKPRIKWHFKEKVPRRSSLLHHSLVSAALEEKPAVDTVHRAEQRRAVGPVGVAEPRHAWPATRRRHRLALTLFRAYDASLDLLSSRPTMTTRSVQFTVDGSWPLWPQISTATTLRRLPFRLAVLGPLRMACPPEDSSNLPTHAACWRLRVCPLPSRRCLTARRVRIVLLAFHTCIPPSGSCRSFSPSSFIHDPIY